MFRFKCTAAKPKTLRRSFTASDQGYTSNRQHVRYSMNDLSLFMFSWLPLRRNSKERAHSRSFLLSFTVTVVEEQGGTLYRVDGARLICGVPQRTCDSRIHALLVPRHVSILNSVLLVTRDSQVATCRALPSARTVQVKSKSSCWLLLYHTWRNQKAPICTRVRHPIGGRCFSFAPETLPTCTLVVQMVEIPQS